MDKNLFETIDPIVNEIADQLTTLIEGDTLSELKQKLADLSRELGVYSVTLEMNLQLCNPDDGQTLPLVQTGLASSDGAMPYQMWNDSTPHRYIVHGDLVIVPHDHCPQCWGRWDFKSKFPTCESCGSEMGKDVRLLLDTDCCPNCEKGTLTASQPQCTECGFSVNPDHIAWG
jgi:hypothetical protein